MIFSTDHQCISETTPPFRVLVIDDEPQICKFLDISLRAQGYRVDTAADGEAGLQALAMQGIDLAVLDLGLPDLDGHEVLGRLREWSQVPVIALTVRADEKEKVRVLDAGANDYGTQPFGVQELMARARALLRTRATVGDAAPVYDDGQRWIDLARREVTLNGTQVLLARKEYALLALLVQHAGRVVTQPQMLRELWGNHHEHDTHYLRVPVGKPRQKLVDSAATPQWIATKPRVGLRFVGRSEI